MTTNYIIDPKIFWLIDIAGTVEVCFIVLAVSSGIALCIYWIGAKIMEDWNMKPTLTIFLSIALSIGAIGASIIPSKDTMILMTAASVATHDNVETVADEIYKIIDYIDEAIED